MRSEIDVPDSDDNSPIATANEVRIVDLATDGRVPYREWYDGIRDRRAKAVIENRLARVRTGNLGDVKSVGKEVYELRIFYGPGYRVYFAKVGTVIVVLLGGGDKSTQSRDISTAQMLWEQNRESVYNAFP